MRITARTGLLALCISAGLLVSASPIGAAVVEGVEYPRPTITIYATPSAIVKGGGTTLTWVTKNTYICTASGAWGGSKARNGSTTIRPSVTSTYRLSCSGRGGSAASAVTVSVTDTIVTPPPPPPPPPATTTPTTTPPTPAVPTCTLVPSKTAVQVNEPFTFTWATTNATYISDPGGKNSPSGTTAPITVATAQTYAYQITAVGSGGSTSCSASVVVTSAPPPPPPPTACSFTVPSCGPGTYPTPGTVDANGCMTNMRCTSAVQPSSPQLVPAPAGSAYPTDGEYAGMRKAGTSAAVVYPNPAGSITYGLNLDKRNVWWVTGTVGLSPIVVPPVATTTPTPDPVDPGTDGGGGGGGFDANIRGATYGGSVLVTISAFADKLDPTDKDSEVLYTTTLSPTTGAQTFKLPLGVWAMRPNLKIVVAAQKTASDALKYGAVIDGLGAYTFGSRPDQGIVNNDPQWKSAEQQQKQLAALAQFPVVWIHDSIRTTGASWPQAPLLKRVQDQGKKIQLVVGPIDEDYTEGERARIPLPPEHSQWGYALPFSKINLDLYEKRLRNNLTSYKNAGVNVMAVEVGNELDLVAFNGDIPLNRAVTDADYRVFAETYAKFLERTVTIVKRPEFYPNAKIILGSPAIDWSPAVGKMDPGKMYAPLKNLNGKNYLALVDGVGVHYYPADNEDGAASIARTKVFLTTIGALDRPLWISEWGFYNNRFPNAAGKDRYRAFVDLYDKILRADVKVVFMTNFALDEFSFPFHLVDQSYAKLPEARFFDHYPSPVPSTVALEPVVLPPVACLWCPLSNWSDELWADLRDLVLTVLD